MALLRRRAVVIAVVAVVIAGAAGAGWVLLNRKPALPSREAEGGGVGGRVAAPLAARFLAAAP